MKGSTGATMSRASIEGGSFSPRSSGMVNLKNGLESKANFARSESLSFKAEGAKPLIDIKQRATNFSKNNEVKEFTSPELANRLSATKSFEARHFERKVNKASNIRLSYARQEMKGLLNNSSLRTDTEAQIKRVRMLELPQRRSESSRQKVFESYQKMTGKRIQEVKPQVNQDLQTKRMQDSFIKKSVNNRLKEFVGRISIRVEAAKNTYAFAEAKPKLSAVSIEKFKNIVTEKVKAQVALNPQMRIETKTASNTQNLPEVKAATQTNINTQLDLAGNLLNQNQVEKATEQIVQNIDSTIQETEVEKAKKKKQPGDPKKRFAYFEIDEKTNKKRSFETLKAFTKARIEAFLRGKQTIRGADVVRFMDETKFRKNESASIERIEPDGTANMIIEEIANAGEIVSLEDIKKRSDSAIGRYTATNLTEKPTNTILGKKEIQNVHNYQNEFPAWMDGKQVNVRLRDNIVEAA